MLAIEAGADGITAHLREDRRHIRDEDMRAAEGGNLQTAEFRNGRDRRNARDRTEDEARMPSASCLSDGRR
jgi:pyridoxine 5'-phosphate synthase PdxJ